ncbi:MAG: GAF domain-containing protein, partial [Betaproteobacteria bacterium]
MKIALMLPSSLAVLSDLPACAREPIHLPGAIQPHGCLLSFHPQTLAVAQVSANVDEFLGCASTSLLGQPITAWLAQPYSDVLLQALAQSQDADVNPLLLQAGTTRLNGVLHRNDGLAILELERAEQGEATKWRVDIDHALKRLSEVDNLQQLLEATVQVVCGLTGFDRAVVYRFDTDGSGEVLAECLAEGMQPYLGLHFPESDIPSQARELYLRNWLRTIPDARYLPVQLTPTLRPDTGAPLDLSYSILRSVSPVHLAYLANMGVRASMSISLIVAGRLWGLISCGHREPWSLPYRVRTACETIGRMVSLQIGALQAGDFQRRQLAKSESLTSLVTGMREGASHVLAGLAANPARMLDIEHASGAAIVHGDSVLRVGACPEDRIVARLAEWLRPRANNDGLFATAQLAIDDPQWDVCALQASGVLAIVLPTPLQPCVIWFRPELIHQMNWAGKPTALDSAHERTGLNPNRSFDLWKQLVRGQSLAWGPAELDAAANLRRFAIEIDLTRQVQTARDAVQARDDLVALVSHDLRTPLSVVVMQAALIQRVTAQESTEASHRLRASAKTIQHAGERMSSLLHDLLDLGKIEAGRFEIAASDQSAAHMIEDACELLQSVAQAK